MLAEPPPNSEIAAYFRDLQDRLCRALAELDQHGQFLEDLWHRPGGGGGRSRVLEGGAVFEKAGVNFSDVQGDLSEELARVLPGEGSSFTATGISIVIHPHSPFVPTVHANWRFLSKSDQEWFGGGSDLTPYYPFREDAVHFHRVWKAVCERHAEVADYPQFKKWCDDYFFLPHRGESRGIGGVFFDYLKGKRESLFAFVRDCGDSFMTAYGPIVQKRMKQSFTPEQRAFQEIRRGRYVEFNLLHDRGTLFGLKTGGRIESILMSLPPVARWPYDARPSPDSVEAELSEFLKPRDWANEL